MLPTLIKEIPAQVINERAAYGPFELKAYFSADEAMRFRAELRNGSALPKGLICTADGVFTGIPGKGTAGNYEVVVTAETDAGTVVGEFILVIKPGAVSSPDYFDKLKAQVWEAVEHRLPIPDLAELSEQTISALDLYYLLERWGILTIWDAFNLDPPGPLVPLKLQGISPHYQVFDRGSCLVGCPKDLYSHERTLVDGLMTAQAMAREVYRRNWTIEMAGFDKLMRAAWVELQHLGDTHGKRLEIINFNPGSKEINLYSFQAIETKRQALE